MLKVATRVREKGTTVRADNARIFALASSCFGSACRGLAPKVRQLKEVRPASRFFSTTRAVQLQDHDGSADRFMKIKPEELISNIKTYKANHQSNTDLQDLIEQWDEKVFYSVGTAMGAGSLALAITLGPVAVSPWVAGVATFLFWKAGYTDLQQDKHTIRRNFPVLGRMRYLLEMFRPEIRQYFVEGDKEATPFTREQRTIVYSRAKGQVDTQPLGTRRDVYAEGYEWALHSMFPTHLTAEDARCIVGGPHCKQPYSASLMNISAMSYGALSDNAILALNTGAKMGGFYHNTGEGGMSKFHLYPGGDICYQIGTGYFGCRNNATGGFCPDKFKETSAKPQVKMIEVKLSQGAKPSHGGILPAAKISKAISEARGVPMGEDCNSPPAHSEFSTPQGLLDFIQRLRDLSGGKPIGFKLCLGHPSEFAAIVHSMIESGIKPDFITVDGGEGGTGAAPPEFSNSLGTPLVEGLVFVNQMLIGAGLREDIKIICSGKVVSGMSLVRNLALGADLCNAARAMMFALGCIQALKCNTNHCPTGIATNNPRLMAGLVPEDKASFSQLVIPIS
jgi:glutamate synthase domain-containing protein 2